VDTRIVGRWLRRVLAGALVATAGPVHAQVDEALERAILESTDGRGTLVAVHAGGPDHVVSIAVHGIRGKPSDLEPIMRKDIAAGNTVKVFAYDDKFRSLTDSSADLAEAIALWTGDCGASPLRIQAHSMGGRIALGALGLLARAGRLQANVTLDLIAVPIAGVTGAGLARLAPPFIPWVRPSKDMAPASRYQRMIDTLRLPGNVEVNAFVGGRDTVFEHATVRYRDLVTGLRATLTVFPDATHTSILDEVARLQ
jgi:hypothetical protein